MERVLREQGKTNYADRFKGFDWTTEEDAFMDGYHSCGATIRMRMLSSRLMVWNGPATDSI